jgi:hypothetical protein
MPPGKCPLCLRGNQEIQDSHYFPRAAYKLSRAKTLKNPNPVQIMGARSVQSSDQVHDFVLCRDCEQLLSGKGESWVIRQLAHEGGFPLLANLHSVPPAATVDDTKVYACDQISGFDCDKLAHFAMGMFWKGHAHNWQNCEHLDLGAYAEPIRKFLRGEGSFPENVALLVRVADMIEPPWGARFPTLVEKRPCHLFNFYLSGVDFALAVGRGIPHYLRAICFCRNPARPLMAALHVGVNEIATTYRAMQKSKPSQSLAAFLHGRKPRE